MQAKAARAGFNMCFGCVDVRDVAKAHVLAMERENAHGRYIVSSAEGVSRLEMAKMLRDDPEFQDYPIPDEEPVPPLCAPSLGFRLSEDTFVSLYCLAYANDPFPVLRP